MASITQTANPAGAASSSSVSTYSGVSIGAAAPDRVVVVCVTSEVASASINSCTIDYGSGDTAMTAGTQGNQTNVYARVFRLAVPTGTTATIKVTFGAAVTANQNHISVYRILDSVYSSTGADQSTDMDATDPLTTGSTTVGTGGLIIAVACGATDTVAKTWSNITEDIDADAGSHRHTTAFSTTAGTATRTCTGGTDGEDGALSWFIFTDNTSPTVALNSPSDTASTGDLTPTLNFTGTDTDSDAVEYQVQVHTDNAFLTQIASDDFNRADGGLGGNWTNYSGDGYAVPEILSNAVRGPVDNSDAPARWTGAGTFADDQFSKAIINFGNAGGSGANRSYAGLIVRAGATSWIQAQKLRADGHTAIYDVTSSGATYTEIANVATEIASGSVVLVTVIGTTVSVYDDGVLVTSGTTTLTTGKPGIIPNDDTDSIDNWSGGNTTPLINALSTTDVGFTAGHPFASGVAKDYTVQSDLTASTTYYWRVRATDPAGSNSYGAWSSTRSFTATAPAGSGAKTLAALGVG